MPQAPMICEKIPICHRFTKRVFNQVSMATVCDLTTVEYFMNFKSPGSQSVYLGDCVLLYAARRLLVVTFACIVILNHVESPIQTALVAELCQELLGNICRAGLAQVTTVTVTALLAQASTVTLPTVFTQMSIVTVTTF